VDNAVLNHCLELVRLRDHDRYLTLLMTPDDARRTLIPLYAFQTEIARIRETVSEPMLGQIRLQWWRDTIDQLFDGPQPRGHEVVEALAAPISAGLYEREGLHGLIDGREQDLDDGMFVDLPDLLSYLHSTSMLLMVVAGRALLKQKHGRSFEPEEAETVQLLGEGYGLTGTLRSIGPMAAQGRVMLPESLLAQHEVETADSLAGTCRPGLRAVIDDMAGEAETRLVNARRLLRKPNQALLPALFPACFIGLYLLKMRSRKFEPFQGTGEVLAFRRQLRLMRCSLSRRF
jgi:phytoene synthase